MRIAKALDTLRGFRSEIANRLLRVGAVLGRKTGDATMSCNVANRRCAVLTVEISSTFDADLFAEIASAGFAVAVGRALDTFTVSDIAGFVGLRSAVVVIVTSSTLSGDRVASGVNRIRAVSIYETLLADVLVRVAATDDTTNITVGLVGAGNTQVSVRIASREGSTGAVGIVSTLNTTLFSRNTGGECKVGGHAIIICCAANTAILGNIADRTSCALRVGDTSYATTSGNIATGQTTNCCTVGVTKTLDTGVGRNITSPKSSCALRVELACDTLAREGITRGSRCGTVGIVDTLGADMSVDYASFHSNLLAGNIIHTFDTNIRSGVARRGSPATMLIIDTWYALTGTNKTGR